jgi:hypothetical protein
LFDLEVLFFGGTFSFSNCHIIGLDNSCLVLIVFEYSIVAIALKIRIILEIENPTNTCGWKLFYTTGLPQFCS